MPTSTRRLDAPPDVVFAALIDADSYPRWLVGAKEVQLDPTWPRPGSGFDHEVGAGPLKVDDRTTVSAIDHGRSLDLRVRARPLLEADVHFEVLPGPDGSTITMTEEPRWPYRLLAVILAPILKRRNDRSLQKFEGLVRERR